MLGFYVLGGLLGWFAYRPVHSILPPAFRQNHPIWSAAFVGGAIGLEIPTILNVVQGLMTK
jgi:hypothetical protein